jgi:hypothetical protein
MADYLTAAIVLIGVPVYFYFIVRILTSGIIRSYFEVKKEFNKTT